MPDLGSHGRGAHDAPPEVHAPSHVLIEHDARRPLAPLPRELELQAVRPHVCEGAGLQRQQVLAALQDVQKNGPGAMQKYANDPEILAVVKELQESLG